MVKILAIDDINDNLISLKAVIDDEFSGAEVFTANNGLDGIGLAVENNPDVILLDIIMPGMDGFEVCKYLKQDDRVSDIPVVFLTALKDDRENRIKALEAGAEGFLSKPIDETELVAQIRAMVKIKAASEQKRTEKERLNQLVEERTIKLAQSEAQLKRIFDNLQDAYFQADLSGNFTVVSPSTTRMYGYSADELTGKPSEMLYSDKQVHQLLLSELNTKSKIEDFVCQGRKKDNTPFWVSMSVQLLYDDAGQVIGTEGMARDITERQNAEVALKNSEEKFKQIFESANVGKSITLPSGELQPNQAFIKLLGYTANELKPKKWQDLTHPDDIERIEKIIAPIENGTQNDARFVKRYRHKNGSVIWADVSFAVQRDSAGKPKYFITTVVDVTEQKLAEEAVRQNNTRLELAMDVANLAWWKMDVKTGNVIFEKRKVGMLGYSPERFKHYTDFMNLVHPEDYEHVMNAMRKHLAGETEKYDIEYRIKTISGNYKWAFDIGTVIKRDDKGKPLTVAGLVQDISKRKEAELELKSAKEKAESSEHRLAQKNKELTERNKFIQIVLDNLPLGVALNNIDNGLLTYMNKKFEEIYGWTTADIHSVSSFFEHVYPDSNYRKSIYEKVMTDISTGDPGQMHWENIAISRSDGSRRIINAANISLAEQNTMVSTVVDITDLHKVQDDLLKAKEKAEESDKLKSAFLANMSHEIRTPLNSIIGFSDLLTDDNFDDQQRCEFARIINENGNSLLIILSDIMDISKIEAGQILVKSSSFAVGAFVAGIRGEFAYKATAKGIELNLDQLNPKDEIALVSDEAKIRQILVNLVSNALKFTHQGTIEIGFRLIDNQVRFHVKDTGIGIPPEFHQQIFERFRQVDSSRNRKYGGNGLGLAISKSLVELLGGNIWMESQPDQGSTFYFTIPVRH